MFFCFSAVRMDDRRCRTTKKKREREKEQRRGEKERAMKK
jgi:hypothetical protein